MGSPQEFVRHVVLSGGTTIPQGIGEHMTNELTEKTYVLPDENIVTVGTERFRRLETLFQPVYGPLVPRLFFPDHHEVRRRYPQRVIRLCRVVKRHDLFQ